MALRQWWAVQTRAARLNISAGLGVAAILALVATSLLVSRGAPELVPVTVVSVPREMTATPALLVTPAPAAAGLSTVGNLKELRDRFGEPPDAKRGRFRIPQLGIDAPLGVRAVAPPGLVMDAPTGPAEVVMYDFSADSRYGGSPGTGGNAIFSGHVDYSYKLPYAAANYHGRAVFYDVRLLAPGDVIDVVIDGQSLRYAVQWRQLVSADEGDWARLLARNVGADAITLITCDGAFNPATQEYSSRTVVRAVRA